MTTYLTVWPGDVSEVTAAGLADALTTRATAHEAWAGVNRADSHMAHLATEAANTYRALAHVLGVLEASSVGLANATARAAYRLMTPDVDHEAYAALAGEDV